LELEPLSGEASFLDSSKCEPHSLWFYFSQSQLKEFFLQDG
jgi:hypothetical protein